MQSIKLYWIPHYLVLRGAKRCREQELSVREHPVARDLPRPGQPEEAGSVLASFPP